MDNLSLENKTKIPIQTRVEAYNLMNELKEKGISRFQLVKEINKKFRISKVRVYDWYANRGSPFGRKRLVYNKELFYVIGALLGDGCAYHWKKKNRYLVNIAGEKEFVEKYSDKLFKCTKRRIKWHPNRKQHIWFLNTYNFELYLFFKKVKNDLKFLENLIKKENYSKNSLQFIEGFFDAEGCVKIIKEEVRKTPKICLDICCTNFEILELVRKLLMKHLNVEARYSIQKAYIAKDGRPRKTSYHLRIYKKDFIRKFFENINTIKLKSEKVKYVNNWLNNGK